MVAGATAANMAGIPVGAADHVIHANPTERGLSRAEASGPADGAVSPVILNEVS